MPGTRFFEYEVDVGKPRFLRHHSYVNVQGVQAIQHHELEGRIGVFQGDVMDKIRDALKYALDL